MVHCFITILCFTLLVKYANSGGCSQVKLCCKSRNASCVAVETTPLYRKILNGNSNKSNTRMPREWRHQKDEEFSLSSENGTAKDVLHLMNAATTRTILHENNLENNGTITAQEVINATLKLEENVVLTRPNSNNYTNDNVDGSSPKHENLVLLPLNKTSNNSENESYFSTTLNRHGNLHVDPVLNKLNNSETMESNMEFSGYEDPDFGNSDDNLSTALASDPLRSLGNSDFYGDNFEHYSNHSSYKVDDFDRWNSSGNGVDDNNVDLDDARYRFVEIFADNRGGERSHKRRHVNDLMTAYKAGVKEISYVIIGEKMHADDPLVLEENFDNRVPSSSFGFENGNQKLSSSDGAITADAVVTRQCYCDEDCRFLNDCCSDYIETCPAVDCTVSPWSSWSKCIRTSDDYGSAATLKSECGPGISTRTREILKSSENGGVACPHLDEQKACYNAESDSECGPKASELALLLPHSYNEARKPGYKTNMYYDLHMGPEQNSEFSRYCSIFTITWQSENCTEERLKSGIGPKFRVGQKVCVQCESTATKKDDKSHHHYYSYEYNKNKRHVPGGEGVKKLPSKQHGQEKMSADDATNTAAAENFDPSHHQEQQHIQDDSGADHSKNRLNIADHSKMIVQCTGDGWTNTETWFTLINRWVDSTNSYRNNCYGRWILLEKVTNGGDCKCDINFPDFDRFIFV